MVSYKCEICGKIYNNADDCKKCEAKGVPPIPIGIITGVHQNLYCVITGYTSHRKYSIRYEHAFLDAFGGIIHIDKGEVDSKSINPLDIHDSSFWKQKKSHFESKGEIVTGYWAIDPIDKNGRFVSL